MAKKNSALLLKIFILLAKLKKPLLRKLANLKKMKKLKLIEQYSYYSYAKEYEFSPSSTPLIQFRRMSRISLKKIYSDLVLICRNFPERRKKKEIYRLEIGSNSLIRCQESDAAVEISNPWSEEEDECVDERAERFIQNFYEEMRRQRNDSSFQLLLQN